jgi:Zn-finger nucleic acid-binding protein
VIVACSACNHRFEGGGYRDEKCPTCGALALATRSCPLCTLLLVARRSEEIVIDHCTTCGGVFVDHATLERTLANLGKTDSLLALLARVPSMAERRPTPRCSSCGQDMQKRMWPGGAGVIVDVCGPHGVFFDAGELHRLLEFARREAREREVRAEEARRHAEAQALTLGPRGNLDRVLHFIADLLRVDK